ncbi:MAG: type II secretion system protein GspM [Solirubrobacterales bacterium]
MIQIAPREKRLAICMAALIGVWATWSFAVKPAQERIRKLERLIPEKQTQVKELQAKGTEYMTLANRFKGLREKMASQDPSFQLMPFLEKMIEQHKLAGRVMKMWPNTIQPQPDYSETVVTIEMQDVTLKQIISFLTSVETTEAVVRVGSLHISKDATNDALLDATVEVYSPHVTNAAAQVAQARVP